MYPWPTASDFDAADDNKDGNLTKAEFVQYISQNNKCNVDKSATSFVQYNTTTLHHFNLDCSVY